RTEPYNGFPPSSAAVQTRRVSWKEIARARKHASERGFQNSRERARAAARADRGGRALEINHRQARQGQLPAGGAKNRTSPRFSSLGRRVRLTFRLFDADGARHWVSTLER